MRVITLSLVLLLAGNLLHVQYVYTINADSVKITNHCDTAEPFSENHTQTIPGFLYNKGRGRTEFRRALQKINDSTYLIGVDTLLVADPNAEKHMVFTNGLTRNVNTITNDLSTGVSGGQSLTGSTYDSTGITYNATTGAGAPGSDHVFTVGTNGALEALRIRNNGQLTVGPTDFYQRIASAVSHHRIPLREILLPVYPMTTMG